MKNFLSYFFWSLCAVFCGVFAFNFSLNTVKFIYNYLNSPSVFYSNNVASMVVSLPKEEKEERKEEKEESKITIFFVGDIMMDRGVESSVLKNGEGDFNFIFNNADFLKGADIIFGNLEGSASDKGEDRGKRFSFRMSPDVVPILRNYGFNVLSVANNHSGDWGRDAFKDSFLRLEEEGILAVGVGNNKEDAKNPKIFEKDGIKIGFIGFNDTGHTAVDAGKDFSGILNADDGIAEIIKKAKEQTDYLVVSFHFGEEYQKTSNDRQKKLARLAIDSGAKIVVGHHPHVAQEIEKYNGGIIAYSLGNFIFDQHFSEDTMQGLALEIVLDKDGIIEENEEIVKLNKFFQLSP